MEWNVLFCNSHHNKIETYNIFSHRKFDEYVKMHIKKCKSKEELANKLKSELQYYFWSKNEWELLIKVTNENRIILYPWTGISEPLDVTDNTMLDWNAFAKKHIKKQFYDNETKIDVFDQVMMNWNLFLDYVWNYSKYK